MDFISQDLQERWRKLSLIEQLANIGSELNRALRWQGKDKKLFNLAVLRTLELLNLTIGDPRWRKRLKEIVRTREVFCDTVWNEAKEHHTSLSDLERYFFYFALAVRLRK